MNRQPSPNTKEIPSKGDLAGAGEDSREQGAKSREDAEREQAEYRRIRRQTGALGGRPAKLTLPLVKVIARDIGFGMTHRAACARHGVNFNTWESALKRKETFALLVEQQNAGWQFNMLQSIQLDLPGSVGMRWLAERRFAEFRKVDTDVQVHQVTHVHQTPEFQQEVAAYARRLDLGVKGGSK